MLKVYNDLTNQKEEFIPIEPGKVSMYVCGMTVYDLCHLGHARVLVVFDVVYRYLMERGYEVNYVRNITDIDDKIIARANENGREYTDLTERFIQAMHEDSTALGVLPPTSEPRATNHIDDILNMVQRLIEQGHAYAADNGDIYFAIDSFDGYGKLSGKSLEDLQAGARVDVEEAKRNPLDFVLWKAAKPGEPFWPSPWGNGRPGWHIECSAMSTCCLGETFDIHGGGADLTFPHHENEIAQSEGATGKPFVNYWLHNGFVRINEEKMSKSLGNFFTVREILGHYTSKEYGGEIIRYFVLSSHYRSPLNYDDDNLDNARAALIRFYKALQLRGLPEAAPSGGEEFRTRFLKAMDDDFNTPEALAVLFDMVREINRLRKSQPQQAAGLISELRQMGGVLGILQADPDSWLKEGEVNPNVRIPTAEMVITPYPPTVVVSLSDEEIDAMIQQRKEARESKNWAEADRIRDQLQDAGIVLEDGAGGTTWRRS